MSKLEQVLTSLQNNVAPVANAMNDFGKEWWGFIITFVFIWWALNKVINIIWSAFRQARGAFNWLRGRRRARRAARSSELIATGSPIDPDWNKNDNPFPAEKQMGPARLGDVMLVGSKPGATTHKSSSQAGLASFVQTQSGRLDLSRHSDN